MAFDICQSTYLNYDKIILYFMSDGEDSFPIDAINQFKNHRILQDMI